MRLMGKKGICQYVCTHNIKKAIRDGPRRGEPVHVVIANIPGSNTSSSSLYTAFRETNYMHTTQGLLEGLLRIYLRTMFYRKIKK